MNYLSIFNPVAQKLLDAAMPTIKAELLRVAKAAVLGVSLPPSAQSLAPVYRDSILDALTGAIEKWTVKL